MKRWCALLLAALALGAPGRARAYEDTATLGVSAGYGHLVSDGLPRNGAAFGVTGSYGLDDIWSLRAQLGYGFQPDASFSRAPLSVFVAGADVIYMVDVFELVPYFGAGIDGIGLLRSGTLGTDFAVHAALGVDWLVSRELALGLEARPVFLLTELQHDPLYLSVMLTGSWLFEL